MPTRRPSFHHWLMTGSILLSLFLSSCSIDLAAPTETPIPTGQVEQPTDQLLAEVDFRVALPAKIPNKQKLSFEVLDEVTGLALNSSRYEMTRVDDLHYKIKLPFTPGSVIKYRYIREGGATAIEYTSLGHQVRYRIDYVQNPGVVEDIVSAWNDTSYKGSFGRIQGQVVDGGRNTPVVGSLVSAGGQQTITASDGSFLLDGLPAGKHNLVVYSLDGSYPTFQQEAVVAASAATQVPIRLAPVQYVKVTFNVKAPDEVPEGIPIRLVGNTYPLGNTFSDLRGGISTIASRAPLLRYLKDRIYSFTIKMPVGLDLRYKYSLGDGFWNAERDNEGNFKVRQMIIPNQDLTINEQIETFTTAGYGPITFSAAIAAPLGKDESLSIQFNPYGWTEPIPMWKMSENRWVYILYSPLDSNVINGATYRYCKNDQCGKADVDSTFGQDVAGNPFKPAKDPQIIKDTIKRWAWTPDSRPTITVTSRAISPKPEGFITGVELTPDYHPSWLAYTPAAFQNIHDMGAGWTILSPTWHFTSATPPVLTQIPGIDSSTYDLSQMALQAHQKGLHIAIHPTVSYYQPASLWWQGAARDANWWQSWFDRYTTFILDHADIATQVGADALVLGDESIAPALPNGVLLDGTSSGVPGDASQRWSALIAAVRSHFKGQIIWRMNYPSETSAIPAFVDEVDQIYIVLNGTLTNAENLTPDDLRNSIAHLLHNDLLSIRDQHPKPTILGIAYPSSTGAASGCVRNGDTCLPFSVFQQAGLDIQSATVDLGEQADIYNAVFEALDGNTWIKGVIADGYYPPVALMDKSISIRGKPAADVVWFWFNRYIKPNP